MNYPQWAHPEKDTFLLNNSIHLCKIEYSDFSGEESILINTLNSTEKERAARFHYKIDRKRYIISKAFLKIILSKIISVQPVDIQFSFNTYDKPYLKGYQNIHFNISHSGNIGLIALTDISEIGIDVEQFRTRMNSEKVARRFFSENEATVFLKLTENDRLQGFFNCWTRKEAFIKALGLGLTMPLKNFEVTLKPSEPAQLLAVDHGMEQAADWTIKDIPMEGEYAAAFAIRNKSFEDYYWMIDSPF